jgi:hypothetical protein
MQGKSLPLDRRILLTLRFRIVVLPSGEMVSSVSSNKVAISGFADAVLGIVLWSAAVAQSGNSLLFADAKGQQ